MPQFIIGEDLLGAVAQCIGAATHAVPYGQVAALIRRLDGLPQLPPPIGRPDAGGKADADGKPEAEAVAGAAAPGHVPLARTA